MSRREPTAPDEDARRRRGDRRTARWRATSPPLPSSACCRSGSSTTTCRPSRASVCLLLGGLDELTGVALENEVDVVVLAIPRLDPTVFRDVAGRAAAAGASVRYLPTFVAALERAVVGTG